MANQKSNRLTASLCSSHQFNHVDVEPVRLINTLKQDVVKGLLSKPRNLPPKYFYDERGAIIFNRICETQEYYLTRTEDKLLRDNAKEIIKLSSPDHIIEFGSGSSRKSCALFDACEHYGLSCTYWAMDICPEMLEECANNLQYEYPWLQVNTLVGDYNAGLGNIKLPEGRCLAMFLGSTIGNINKSEAVALLREIGILIGVDSTLLLGADRVKHKALLVVAYNDAQGMTASFNLNVLNVLNRELNADFSIEDFFHHAIFNENKNQVEMYLVSKRNQKVNFGSLDCSIEFERGETICTEISRKFTRDDIDQLIYSSQYVPMRHFIAGDEAFSLTLSRVGNI